jgi:hypothetical protein
VFRAVANGHALLSTHTSISDIIHGIYLCFHVQVGTPQPRTPGDGAVIPDKYMIAFDTLAHAQEGQAAFPAYVLPP